MQVLSQNLLEEEEKPQKMTLKIAGNEVTITISSILIADQENSCVHRNKVQQSLAISQNFVKEKIIISNNVTLWKFGGLGNRCS